MKDQLRKGKKLAVASSTTPPRREMVSRTGTIASYPTASQLGVPHIKSTHFIHSGNRPIEGPSSNPYRAEFKHILGWTQKWMLTNNCY